MKKHSLTFLFSLFSFFVVAQDNCCTALPLFGPYYGSGFIPVGVGTTPPDPVEDVFPCDCIQGEGGWSRWYAFSCTSSGTFEMLIKPLTISETRFDFALYADCSCSNDFALACDTATAELTGIADEPFASFGVAQQTGFAPTVTLAAGTNYYLFVDNVTGNGDIAAFQFGGTAGIGPPIYDPGPPITGPTEVCPGATATYSATIFHPAEWNEWWATPVFQGVEAASSSDVVITWPETPGTYELCVRGLRPCGNTAPNCITVEVAPIPVSEVNDVICYGTLYFDGNGNAYASAGSYPVTYQSFYGCDSVVILNLEVAPSEFIVNAELKCEGDCVEFNGQIICESGTYQEVYENQFGCDSTVVLNYVAVPTESVIEGLDTLSCKKLSFELDGSMSLGGDDLTYMWLFENGDTLGTDATLTVTEGGEYTLVTRSVVGIDTCEVEETVEVLGDFDEPENVTASGGEVSCNETSVMLMANSSSPGVIYQWTGPNNFQSPSQNPTVNVPGDYLVTVTGLNGCTASQSVTVVGNTEEPVASANGGTLTCGNTNVTLMGGANLAGSSFSWLTPSGAVLAEQNPSVNQAGTYTLTVTGPNGCTSTALAFVDENTETPTANAGEGGTLNCFANQLVLDGTGSSIGGNFNYLWTTPSGNILAGENTLTPTVDEAGPYTILVTNTENGCTSASTVNVSESPPVGLEISTSSNVDCFGTSTGSATAIALGGDGTYFYEWSNSETTASIGSLAAGNYSLTVTDGEGCTQTTSVNISQPALLEVMASATGQMAVGVNDGTASATPTGGTPNYAYLWSNGATDASLMGLAPGSYTVTVTDENGCTAEQTVTVNEFECLVKAEIEKTDVTCNGLSNGTATVVLESAEPPIEFLWSNDETAASIDNLAPGTYSVTAVDDNGCEVVSSVTILEPAELNANATASDETAAGANDGTATADPTGGTSPFTYEWSNGETTQTIENLEPGIYMLTVTDSLGCETVQEVTVFSFGCQILTNITSSDVSCAGLSDGQATVTLTGGIAPFEYVWSNDETTPTIENLPAGIYGVTIVDDDGCEVETEVTINEPPAILGEIVSVTNAGCGTVNGSATVAGEGGMGTLNYSWSSGGNMPTEDDLEPGDYMVTISDETECEIVLDITIGFEDIAPPTVLTEDVEIILDNMGSASIIVSDIDNGSFDDCEITELFLDITEFNCSDIGENTVVLTAEDIAGNISTETAIVTVIDNIPPTLETTTVTLGLNVNGTATLPPGILVVSSSDNCGPVVLSVFPTEFNCDDLGENIVTLTATDPSGNETVQEVTVNIVDDVDPELNCPEDIQLPYCDAIGLYEISFSDNCELSTEPVLVEGLPSGENFPPGQTIVTYELTDESGNIETCSFEVNVSEEISISLVEIVNETGAQMNGGIDVDISGGNPNYTYSWTDEDGNVVSTEEDATGLSAGEYTLEITDADGCTSSEIYVVDMINSTNDFDLENYISIYPNPTSGDIFLEISGLFIQDMDVSIYDLIGHNIMERNIAGDGKYIFDISEYPSGVYVMEIITDNAIVSKRFVLNK